MSRYLTAGLTILAGAALLETALVPGLVIGGAAVLAPKYLPGLRRRLRPLFATAGGPQTANRPDAKRKPEAKPSTPVALAPASFGIKQAIAKTITFRIIVTTLDFTSNYVVIGELATAAGLSTFNLVAGPLFYFTHETAWNYFGPAGEAVDMRAPLRPHPDASQTAGFTISRALAKTITFRTIATVVDFTANYVVVRDLATAAGLSAFGFFLGPFVYLGHEKAWDYFATRSERAAPPSPKLLPAPA
jgi:uncharacterized membrane protein